MKLIITFFLAGALLQACSRPAPEQRVQLFENQELLEGRGRYLTQILTCTTLPEDTKAASNVVPSHKSF